jgi:L-lactate dehydrogenase complex protein LldF
VEVRSQTFKENAAQALADAQLQRALRNVPLGFIDKRAKAKAKLPEFETLREQARAIKDHTLAHLDLYLEHYERKVREAGGHVHYAETAADARAVILGLLARLDVKSLTKGKSMVSEEIALNDALEQAGIAPVETDLGEYIIQLRREYPSHIIAPAVHLNKDQIEADFRAVHRHLPADRRLDEGRSLVAEARQVLREKFLAADAGLTGANFLIAETGSSIIVTNEGNGDLTQTLPRAHIVLTTVDRIVPTLEDVTTILRLLARSATGQEFSSYTTMSTGPRRRDDPDGPGEYHVVILDNGRTGLLGTEYQDVLRCIRCGACLNHCPVYQAVGGHAYGWVYPGPIGSVLTPALVGIDRAAPLPNASTFCGRCEEVCPMKIPLPGMMRHWREREFERHLTPAAQRWGLTGWAFLATRPRLYRLTTQLAARAVKLWARGKGSAPSVPLAGGWTKHRDLPAPEGRTFMEQWQGGNHG